MYIYTQIYIYIYIPAYIPTICRWYPNDIPIDIGLRIIPSTSPLRFHECPRYIGTLPESRWLMDGFSPSRWYVRKTVAWPIPIWRFPWPWGSPKMLGFCERENPHLKLGWLRGTPFSGNPYIFPLYPILLPHLHVQTQLRPPQLKKILREPPKAASQSDRNSYVQLPEVFFFFFFSDGSSHLLIYIYIYIYWCILTYIYILMYIDIYIYCYHMTWRK